MFLRHRTRSYRASLNAAECGTRQFYDDRLRGVEGSTTRQVRGDFVVSVASEAYDIWRNKDPSRKFRSKAVVIIVASYMP